MITDEDLDLDEPFGSFTLGSALNKLELEIDSIGEQVIQLKGLSVTDVDIEAIKDHVYDVKRHFVVVEDLIIKLDKRVRKLAIKRFFSEKC
ncbi:MAG: hypothetical protein IJ730_01855 [Alphaproteobacteria bacterium]|nr:hypothetical protein [Alphaproteobacteria bacterium]